MSFRRTQSAGLIRGDWTAPTVVRGPAFGPSQEIPELRKKASPQIEVVIGRGVRKRIGDNLFWQTRLDGLESGGFLFARPTRTWEKRVELIEATHTGDAKRRSASLTLDTDEWARAERAFEAEGVDLALCGFWHSHPQTRNASPSSTDLASLLAVLDWHEEHGRSAAYSVGLIYAASEYLGDSWARPHLDAWVVRREGYSRRAICEPANVRERR
jgi:hypothetical protein